MLANFLRIDLRISHEAYDYITINFSEFIVNPSRMLRMLTNAIANFANACERLTDETTTQRMRGETPCQCFAVSLLGPILARLS